MPSGVKRCCFSSGKVAVSWVKVALTVAPGMLTVSCAAGVGAQRCRDVDVHASPFWLGAPVAATAISMASSSNFLSSSVVPVSRKELVMAAFPCSTAVMT